MGFFHIVRGRCRADLISAGIKMARQTFDRSSLSGGIPALKAKDHRDPQTVEFSVEHFQPFLELVQFFPVFRLLKTLCQVRFCKDPFFISVRRVPYLLVLRKFLARAASGELGYFLMSSFMRALAAAFWFILLKQMPCFR